MKRHPRRVLFSAVAVASLTALPAQAIDIAVNVLTDTTGVSGECSIRDALQAAATRTAIAACPAGTGDDDRVVLPAGVITLKTIGANEDDGVSGDLDLSGAVRLIGHGSGTTIDGNGTDRVLDVLPGANVVVNRLTIRNGRHPQGAGVRNRGTLTLIDVVVKDNAALGENGLTGGGRLGGGGGGGGGVGGGVYNAGTLTVEGGSIFDNRAVGGNGGVGGDDTHYGQGLGGGNGGDGGVGVGGKNATGIGGGGGGGGGGGLASWENPRPGGAAGLGGGTGGNGQDFQGLTGGGGGGGGLGGGLFVASGSVWLGNSRIANNRVDAGVGGTPGRAATWAGTGQRGFNGQAWGGGVFVHEGSVRVVATSITGNASSDDPDCAQTSGDLGAGNLMGRPGGLCDVVVHDDKPWGAPLVDTVPEPAGDNCETGGIRIDVGHDRNGDNTLEADEVQSSSYVCDGEDGADGTAGLDTLTKTSPVSASDACEAGGWRIEAGLDADRDGQLQDEEVGSAVIVCNGLDGRTEAAEAGGCDSTGATPGLVALLAAVAFSLRRSASRLS